jgi:type IV pilus assembly protein PilQ
MKKYLSKIIPVLIIFWIFLYAPVGVITDLYADQHMNPGAKSETANVGYLENVLFDKLSGRERVRLVVSQQPSIAPTSIQGDNSLLISLENLYAPDNMREIQTWKQAVNVTDVQLQQRSSEGKQWINLKINLKEMVPYSIRQEGKIVVIDFNISSVEEKLSANKQKSGDAIAGNASSEGSAAKKQAGREAANR